MSDEGLGGNRLIDFHSHVLPQMDDGSSSVEESLRMLESSAAQGVGCLLLTPHFYATRDNPAHFIEKRARSYSSLLEAVGDRPCPRLICGAEVEYFEGITAMRELDEMRIGDSKGILIEMPFRRWSKRVVSDVIEIHNRRDFRVVLAHIERYLKLQDEQTIAELVRAGVRMQSNASFFTGGLIGRQRALRALDAGYVHLLGSDCHNMSTRKPNLGGACELIAKKRGTELLYNIMGRAASIISDTATAKNGGSV